MRGRFLIAGILVALLASPGLGADFREGVQSTPSMEQGAPSPKYPIPESVLNEMRRKGMEPTQERQGKEQPTQPFSLLPPLTEEPPSDFELFVSGKIEIT